MGNAERRSPDAFMSGTMFVAFLELSHLVALSCLTAIRSGQDLVQGP